MKDETKDKLKKYGNWGLNIAFIFFIIIYFEGEAQKWGLIGFIIFIILVASFKMFKGRKQLQYVFSMAADLGIKHKEIARRNKNDRRRKRRKKNNNNV